MRSVLNKLWNNIGKVAGIVTGLGVIAAFLVGSGATVFAKKSDVAALEQKMILENKRLEAKCVALEKGIDTICVGMYYMKDGIDELRKGVNVLLYRDATRTR